MCSGDAMAPMELRSAYGWIIVLSESAVIDSRKDYFAVRLVRSGIVDRAKIPSWVIAVFDLNWTASEKKIARRAFQTALDRELAALIEESKKRMNQVSTSEGLWEFEEMVIGNGAERSTRLIISATRFCLPFSRSCFTDAPSQRWSSRGSAQRRSSLFSASASITADRDSGFMDPLRSRIRSFSTVPPDSVLAAEVSLGSLYGHMAKVENWILLKFSSRQLAESCAGPSSAGREELASLFRPFLPIPEPHARRLSRLGRCPRHALLGSLVERSFHPRYRQL